MIKRKKKRHPKKKPVIKKPQKPTKDQEDIYKKMIKRIEKEAHKKLQRDEQLEKVKEKKNRVFNNYKRMPTLKGKEKDPDKCQRMKIYNAQYMATKGNPKIAKKAQKPLIR